MKHRDIPVIAYLTEDNIIYCRACLSLKQEEPILNFHSYLTNRYECLVKGNGDLKPDWKFNNTKHKIVLTIDTCNAKDICSHASLCQCSHLKHIQQVYREHNYIL